MEYAGDILIGLGEVVLLIHEIKEVEEIGSQKDVDDLWSMTLRLSDGVLGVQPKRIKSKSFGMHSKHYPENK